jgi:photosystem II stability/assembly factor-like uncharacterized protein
MESNHVAVALALVLAGCTFYTSCPEDNRPAQTGGTNGSGGTDMGTSGGSAGERSLGGEGGTDPGEPSGTGGTGGTGMRPGEGGQGGVIPAPDGEWIDVTSNLANMDSTCGNMALLSAKPGENLVIAGVGLIGLWGSTDGGETWNPLGEGLDSDAITNTPSAIVYDPEDPDTFWESGIYGSGGVYKTTDGGKSFLRLGTVYGNDSLSIDFSDPERQTLVATGHEMGHTFHRSTDGGENWTLMGEGVPATAKACFFAHVVDADTFLLGCAGGLGSEGRAGIYRSTDAGRSFERVSTYGGALAPLVARDGAIYWATEAGGGMVVSDDGGATWERNVGPGVLMTIAPVELPDGRLASIKDDAVALSADRGATWRAASSRLPFTPLGLIYAPFQKAFFVWRATCENTVPEDSIRRYDFDYESE